ncbi:MAG TPA: MFS transporter [Thermodesulfobacteriota bacterium]|nr:MFS transporter [Thermodesulfobacteriota bacterium]
MANSTAPLTEAAAPAAVADEAAAASAERSLVLWLTNVSHAVNHFQNQMVAVLYPVIMAELGFGYAQLGVLTAVRNFLGSGTQVIYGFLTPFVRRSRLLGIGNLVLSLGTLLSGFVGSYASFLAARSVASMGSSAQHPVGSSLLAAYFPKNRGTVLSLNNSLANVGSLLAPVAAGLLLTVLTWRQIFVVVAFASLAMAVAYWFPHDRVGNGEAAPPSRRARLAQGKASYLRVLRNRNMLVVSLVMMVGAAGRGEGVNQAYLGPHLVHDLALPVALAGVALTVLQIGGIVGPVGFGWLSDRMSRKGVIQASLLLSALATWWLAWQGAYLPLLLLNLVVYGAVTHSRNSLTQALVADSISDEDRDAAFSVYYFIGFISGPIWALVTGFLMDAFGFATAFSVLAFSYLAGMLLMFFVEDPRPAAAGGR